MKLGKKLYEYKGRRYVRRGRIDKIYMKRNYRRDGRRVGRVRVRGEG